MNNKRVDNTKENYIKGHEDALRSEKRRTGSSAVRLITYMKPYAHWVIFALFLVLCLTGFDLYRPMLVGDAIDTFGADGDYDIIIDNIIIEHMNVMGEGKTVIWQLFLSLLYG